MEQSTTYYYKAKAVGHGTGYSTEKSFTTLTAPTITTSDTNKKEARFTPSKIVISYDQVKSNEMLDISISIANTGDKQDSYFVPLIINGYMEQGVLVYVNPNSIQRVIFKVARSEPGTYDVSIAGKNAKFTVI